MSETSKLVGLTITSVDIQKGVADGTGFVYLNAIGADETPDIYDEIFDYKTSKPFIEEWSIDAETTTKAAGQVISYGNVRAQHGAAGAANVAGTVCEPIFFEDAKKKVGLRIKVVDKDACMKVAEGAYRGISVKGAVVGKKWKDGKYWRYTVKPTEFSLVDKPANPNATITVIKADGATEIIQPEPQPESLILKAATILQEMSPQEVKELITMAEDVQKAAAIEKMKAARKAHDQNSSCLSGYCGHGDVSECAEKVAENHGKIMDAFKDSSRKKEAEKSAETKTEKADEKETEEEKKAREKKEAAVKSAESNMGIDDLRKLIEDQSKQIAALSEAVSKSAETKAAGRPTPIQAGSKLATKAGENGADEKDLVEKKAALDPKDPHYVSKAAAIDRAAEPEMVKL